MAWLVTALAGAALVALERLPGVRFKRSPLLRPFFVSDAWYLITGYVFGTALTVAFVMSASATLGSLDVPRLAAVDLPLWLGAVLVVVLLDIGNYVAHWLMHRYDTLWEFHKAHHSSETLDWLAMFRSHIVEQMLRRLIAPVGLILLGMPADAVALGGGFFNAWAMLIHSNLALNLSAIEPLLVTPRLHRAHHAPATTNTNFGTVLTIWDRLFRGRFVMTETGPDVRLGVPDEVETYPQGWWPQFREPFRRLTKSASLDSSTPDKLLPPSVKA